MSTRGHRKQELLINKIDNGSCCLQGVKLLDKWKRSVARTIIIQARLSLDWEYFKRGYDNTKTLSKQYVQLHYVYNYDSS